MPSVLEQRLHQKKPCSLSGHFAPHEYSALHGLFRTSTGTPQTRITNGFLEIDSHTCSDQEVSTANLDLIPFGIFFMIFYWDIAGVQAVYKNILWEKMPTLPPSAVWMVESIALALSWVKTWVLRSLGSSLRLATCSQFLSLTT